MHTQLGTTSSENVVVGIAVIGLVVSVTGAGCLRDCCSGRNWAVKGLSFRPELGSGFEEVWLAV